MASRGNWFLMFPKQKLKHRFETSAVKRQNRFLNKYTPREEMGLQRVGLFLIIPASAHSLTSTLKLICSLLTFFLEKITHKLIDQSKRFGSGRELSDFRELGTNQHAVGPFLLLGCTFCNWKRKNGGQTMQIDCHTTYFGKSGLDYEHIFG